MREIKFRAWDMSNKKMIYVQEGLSLEIHDDGSGCISDLSTESILEFSPWEYQNRKSFDDKKIMADAGILMQYTGLKDKNGKDIYEGDVIKWEGEFLVVRWGRVGWTLFSKLFKRFGLPDGTNCSEINTEGYTHNSEVIGNIHENPELLK